MSIQGSVPPKLDPQSLYSEQEKRDALKLKTYNNILEQIHNKIKTISRQPNNDKSLLFQVPEFVMGVPRFSTRDCILYMVWNLRQSHFEVQYYPPNLLWISWRKHDTLYKEERNPIVQTMRNALVQQQQQQQPVEAPKPVLKKTTQQYVSAPAADTTRKVTFI
jgi:Family of unknown function (DUF5759)